MKENLLSEYIYTTWCKVCHENFTIIKGETTSPDVLNMKDIVSDYSEKYPQYQIKNIIDLIDYKESITDDEELIIQFSKQETKPFSQYFVTSEFPFGWSNKDKSIYFYFKEIFKRIPQDYPHDWMKFTIKKENYSIDFTIEDNYFSDNDGRLKSTMLDCFDFNLISYHEKIKKIDFEEYLLNPSQFSFEINSNGFFIV